MRGEIKKSNRKIENRNIKICAYCGKEFECYPKKEKGKMSEGVRGRRGTGSTSAKRPSTAQTCSRHCSSRYVYYKYKCSNKEREDYENRKEREKER